MYEDDLLRKCYFEPEGDKVRLLINYLNHISGKELTTVIIRQVLLKTHWKERELGFLCRCHCKAASIYLGYLLDSGQELNGRQVKTIIADIAHWVARLDPNQIVSFIVVSTNTLPSAIHFKHSKSLFYEHDLPQESKNNYNNDLLVIYSLRLAMESRVRRFLGIDYATVNGKPVSVSSLLSICKGLREVVYAPTLDWVQVELVNKWLNHYMHRLLRPYPWLIHQAFGVLDTILEPAIYRHEHREINSLFASTVVLNEDRFIMEVKTKLEEVNTGIEVKWLNSREILKPGK